MFNSNHIFRGKQKPRSPVTVNKLNFNVTQTANFKTNSFFGQRKQRGHGK